MSKKSLDTRVSINERDIGDLKQNKVDRTEFAPVQRFYWFLALALIATALDAIFVHSGLPSIGIGHP